MVTNAHQAGVAVKSAKTGLDGYVDRIVDAFEVGYLKMRSEYWPACRRLCNLIHCGLSILMMTRVASMQPGNTASGRSSTALNPVRNYPPSIPAISHPWIVSRRY